MAGQPDLVAILREEILAVIAKHVAVDRDKVQVKLERGEGVSTLEIDIELPLTAAKDANGGKARKGGPGEAEAGGLNGRALRVTSPRIRAIRGLSAFAKENRDAYDSSRIGDGTNQAARHS